MDRLAADLRYAVRLLLTSPGWSVVAIVSLALGIGANAVVFSLVDAVLLDPFPYRDPGRLVLIWGSRSEETTPGISGADLADWRQRHTFEDLDAFLGNLPVSLSADESDRVQAACIGHRVLPLLGVRPVLGRNFTAEEARFGATPVVIISDELWRARFASDPLVIGRSIALDGVAHEIIGVTAPGFFFPDTNARLWRPAPCGFANFDDRGAMVLHAVGRLRDGVTLSQAQSDVDVINARLARAFPDTNRRKTAGVFPFRHVVVGKYERALWTLVWAIALVLLIACVNVVHLQLARGVDRELELAVRAASGAGRARLLRQLLTEAAVLVAVAGLLAIAVAGIGVRMIHAFALTGIPRMEHARLDGRVLAFTFAISMVTALVSGVWPAWKVSGVRVSETLKLGATATSGRARNQLRDLLATTEIAAAVTLLVASGLVVKSFVLLSRAEWGFNPDRLLLIDAKVPRDRWRDRIYLDDLVDRLSVSLRTVPTVVSVSVSGNVPIRWSGWAPRPVAVDGRVVSAVTAAVWTVRRDYFSTAGIPLDAGREFSDLEASSEAHTTVISRALARELWPGQSAIGKKLQILAMKPLDEGKRRALMTRFIEPTARKMGWPEDPSLYDVADGITWEVVGVVRDVKMFGLTVGGNPALYLDARQLSPDSSMRFGVSHMKVLIRTSGSPLAVINEAKARINGVDPSLSFEEIASMADLVAQSIGGRGSNKLLLIVATIFGTLSLTFAAIGIYGVVAHNVTQRLREIGIRVALGASRAHVVRIVVGYALRLLAGGLALGVTIAWAATRGMKALLFATQPLDPLTYAAVVLVLSIAALIASAIPLRRALDFNPVALFRA